MAGVTVMKLFQVLVDPQVKKYFEQNYSTFLEFEASEKLSIIKINEKKVFGMIVKSNLSSKNKSYKMFKPTSPQAMNISINHHQYKAGLFPSEEDKNKIAHSLTRYFNDCFYLYIDSTRKFLGVDGAIREFMQEYSINYDEMPLDNSRRNYHRWKNSLTNIKNNLAKASHYKISQA